MTDDPTTTETTPEQPPSPSVTAGMKIGYARVSTSGQDLSAQRQALAALGWRQSGSTSTTA